MNECKSQLIATVSSENLMIKPHLLHVLPLKTRSAALIRCMARMPRRVEVDECANDPERDWIEFVGAHFELTGSCAVLWHNQNHASVALR